MKRLLDFEVIDKESMVFFLGTGGFLATTPSSRPLQQLLARCHQQRSWNDLKSMNIKEMYVLLPQMMTAK